MLFEFLLDEEIFSFSTLKLGKQEGQEGQGIMFSLSQVYTFFKTWSLIK